VYLSSTLIQIMKKWERQIEEITDLEPEVLMERIHLVLSLLKYQEIGSTDTSVTFTHTIPGKLYYQKRPVKPNGTIEVVTVDNKVALRLTYYMPFDIILSLIVSAIIFLVIGLLAEHILCLLSAVFIFVLVITISTFKNMGDNILRDVITLK
jgi:hypothetical protein